MADNPATGRATGRLSLNRVSSTRTSSRARPCDFRRVTL
jgi:hypothetical protein